MTEHRLYPKTLDGGANAPCWNPGETEDFAVLGLGVERASFEAGLAKAWRADGPPMEQTALADRSSPWPDGAHVLDDLGIRDAGFVTRGVA